MHVSYGGGHEPLTKRFIILVAMEIREPDPVVVPKGEGNVLSVFGDAVTCKLTSEDTGGAFSMFEESTPAQGSSLLHMHHREDETCCVLEGEYEVQCGDRHFKATAGSVVFLPRDIPHAFRNLGAGVARMLCIVTPAGVEDFFEEVSQLPGQPTQQARLSKVAKKHGIEILGAPLWQKRGNAVGCDRAKPRAIGFPSLSRVPRRRSAVTPSPVLARGRL